MLCLYIISIQNLFLQVFLRGRKHQLDSIELVDLGSTRIIVDGHNIRRRELMADLLDNALANDVVWQAGKRLCTDDIACTLVDQLEHLSG